MAAFASLLISRRVLDGESIRAILSSRRSSSFLTLAIVFSVLISESLALPAAAAKDGGLRVVRSTNSSITSAGLIG